MGMRTRLSMQAIENMAHGYISYPVIECSLYIINKCIRTYVCITMHYVRMYVQIYIYIYIYILILKLKDFIVHTYR